MGRVYFILGQWAGQFIASLILPILWLIIARMVLPKTQRGIRNAYRVAMVLAWPTAFLNPRIEPSDPITTPGLLFASLVATGVLFLLMLRATRKFAPQE